MEGKQEGDGSPFFLFFSLKTAGFPHLAFSFFFLSFSVAG